MSDSNSADDAAGEGASEPGGVMTSADRVTASRVKKPKKQGSLAKEIPILLIVAIGLAFLIKTLFVQAFFIPSGSMQNTLQIHDRVLVNKLIYDFRDPHRGEVVVFNGKNSGFANIDESGSLQKSTNPIVKGIQQVQSFIGLGGNPNESDFIKRVVAVGGDTISCPAIPSNAMYCKNVVVNGHAINESAYLFEGGEGDGRFSTEVGPYLADQMAFTQRTIPKGQLFVMGDHRNDSSDSRFNGTIPVNEVIGRAFIKVWPPSRIGGIGVPKAFQGNLASAIHVGDVGAAPMAAGVLVFPVAGLRRRRSRRRAGAR